MSLGGLCAPEGRILVFLLTVSQPWQPQLPLLPCDSGSPQVSCRVTTNWQSLSCVWGQTPKREQLAGQKLLPRALAAAPPQVLSPCGQGRHNDRWSRTKSCFPGSQACDRTEPLGPRHRGCTMNKTDRGAHVPLGCCRFQVVFSPFIWVQDLATCGATYPPWIPPSHRP